MFDALKEFFYRLFDLPPLRRGDPFQLEPIAIYSYGLEEGLERQDPSPGEEVALLIVTLPGLAADH